MSENSNCNGNGVRTMLARLEGAVDMLPLQ